MLTIKKLTKSIAGRTLFEDADFIVNWGERVALVGPNGAGKSTLLKIIIGEDKADSGRIDRDDYGEIGYLAQESGDPGDDTILQIAMATSPELRDAMRVMRECEVAGTTGVPEFAEAQDKFEELNGYQLEPKAKKVLGGLGYKQEEFTRPAKEFFRWLGDAGPLGAVVGEGTGSLDSG